MELNEQVQIYAGGTWLGENLPLFRDLEAKLEELKTRQDAIPKDFAPRVFLQFLRGAVNEIKRVTAENHAFREALKTQNAEANEKPGMETFAGGTLIAKE